MAVTLALAFATKRMTYEKLLVRILGSCETMANASVVCTDKTGTLTQNVMTVVAGFMGINGKFVRSLEENASRTNAAEGSDDFSIDLSELNSVLTPALQQLLNESIAVNSTAFEDKEPETEKVVFVGNKTESALLRMVQDLGYEPYQKVRDRFGGQRTVQVIPFSSERKAMGVVVRLDNGKYRLYIKGASEVLSKKCTKHVVVTKDNKATVDTDVKIADIDETKAANVADTITFLASQMLRTISLCYRDYESWPPAGSSLDEEKNVRIDSPLHIYLLF